MRMQPDFEKSNEIYFRLGIIYKQQQKYQSSLEVFHPVPLNIYQVITDDVLLHSASDILCPSRQRL